MLVGQVMVGGWVSSPEPWTVTVKLQPDVLPEASVAVQVTELAPSANVEPLGGLQLVLTPGQLSVALTVQVTLDATEVPPVVFVTIFAGQVIAGGCVSLTVTVKLQLTMPQPLEAVQLTVFVPTGNEWGDVMTVEPTLHSVVGVGLPVALAAKATLLEHWPEAAGTVMLAGQPTVGPVFTVNAALQLVVQPLASVTVTV